MRGFLLARVAAVALAVLLSPTRTASAGQLFPLTPVDESAKCAGFVEFKTRMADVIRRKNASALLEVIDPDIRYTFGPGNGRDSFKATRLDDPPPESGDVWSELAEVLRLGGRCDGDSFTAPYVWTDWPDQFEGFDFAAVIGERVRVRERPSATARVIASLSFSIVRTVYTPDLDSAWQQVTLADGRTGYVANRFLRSPIDIRATFVRRNGQWWIVMFIGGD